jgi:hypothetical protein
MALFNCPCTFAAKVGKVVGLKSHAIFQWRASRMFSVHASD